MRFGARRFHEDILKKSMCLQQLLFLSPCGFSTSDAGRVKAFAALALDKRPLSPLRIGR
jgi:hypothetical protein